MAEAMIEQRLQEMAEQGLYPFVHRPNKLVSWLKGPSVLNDHTTPRNVIKIKLKRHEPPPAEQPLKMFRTSFSEEHASAMVGSKTLAKDGSNSEEIEPLGAESGSALREEMGSKAKKRAGSVMRCHVKQGASRSTRFDAVFCHLKAGTKKQTPLFPMKIYVPKRKHPPVKILASLIC